MLEVKNIYKTYRSKQAPEVRALVDVSLKFERCGMVFVLGKSGSGKSTFLNVVGGLDRYDSGEIVIKGKSSREFTGSDFDSYRNTYLGFVFQEYNIIEEFTIEQNIGLALELQHKHATSADIESILQEVDLGGYGNRYPNQISGGQKQRVAIARALIKDPEIIFADEPTGALDSNTGAAIFETLRKLSKTKLVIVVSHDREFGEIYGDRIIEFKDGRVISDQVKSKNGFEEQIVQVDGAELTQNTLNIPHGAKLTQAHIEAIEQLLQQSTGNLVITNQPQVVQSVSTQSNKGVRGVFEDTDESKLDFSYENDYRQIKSRLPLRQASKMACSSMKHKKGRLVFSIILAVFSVMFFGFSVVVGAFSERDVVVSTMREFDYKHIVVSKSVSKTSLIPYFGGSESLAFTDEERQQIMDISGGAIGEYYSMYGELPLKDTDTLYEYDYKYFSKTIYGIVLSDDLQNMGLPVPEVYGRYPQAANEILISNYHAQHFMAFGMVYYERGRERSFYPQNINEVLSYWINLGGLEVQIVGIINFDIERYAVLQKTATSYQASALLKKEFSQRAAAEIGNIYGTTALKDYFTYYGSNYVNCLATFNIEGIDYIPPTINASMTTPISNLTYLEDASNLRYVDINGQEGNVPKLKKGEVIINLSSIITHKMLIDTKENNYYAQTSLLSAEQMMEYAQEWGLDDPSFRLEIHHFLRQAYLNSGTRMDVGTLDGLKVVGFLSMDVYPVYNVAAIAQLSQSDFDDIATQYYSQNLFVNLDNNTAYTRFGRSFLGTHPIKSTDLQINYGYSLPFATEIIIFGVLFGVLSRVFAIIAIALCIFAILLLLNFISTSVIYKRKEIGILRAIGARKYDVTAIFLVEGMYIAGIISAISIFCATVTVILFNNLVTTLMDLPLTLLSITPLAVLLMIAVTFVSVAIASILPVRRVASMRPIDAIRAR